jgi:hypothetical protein
MIHHAHPPMLRVLISVTHRYPLFVNNQGKRQLTRRYNNIFKHFGSLLKLQMFQYRPSPTKLCETAEVSGSETKCRGRIATRSLQRRFLFHAT